MDLNTVEAIAVPTRRDQVWPLGPGDAVLAGGTWLFSEPQVHLRRLVDITRLGWEPITVHDNGIDIAATCTIERIAQLSSALAGSHPDWRCAPLFRQCCTALLASFKVWKTATVGGNVCLAFPAGAMISLFSALDAQVVVWRPDGTDYAMPITEFITGEGTTARGSQDVLRSITLPASALRGCTAFRKLAPSALGRSGIVVIGRRAPAADGGRVTVSITAATVRPYVFEFESRPSAEALASAHACIPDDAWTRDAHGDPDWRRAVSSVLAEQIRAELT
ncbi:MAG: FAD binding domain-containing protein [Mycobacterium sp.]